MQLRSFAERTHCTKYPRDFHGQSGAVNFKTDLAGDNAAKQRYIRENGFEAWNALPYDSKSPTAKHVVGGVIPHAGMKRTEYLQLSLSEKTKLCGEVGDKGIDIILSRR